MPHRHNHPHPNNHYHHRGRFRGGPIGIGAFLIALIIVGIIVGVNAALTSSAPAAGLSAVGAATGFSVATLGIGAAILYGLGGLAYMFSAAKECYNSDKNVFAMIKSRIVNEDGLSFKGVMKSIGAVLWSPFLLIGGAVGMAVRGGVNAYKKYKASKSADQGDSSEETQSESEQDQQSLSSTLQAMEGLSTTKGTKVNATPDSDPAKPVVDIFSTPRAPQKLPKPKVEEVDTFELIEDKANGPLSF